MLETLGIAAGQSAINQGLGMLNMDLQEEANKRQQNINIISTRRWLNIRII